MIALVASARSLRKAMTDAERRLWQHLRLRQLTGARFRRQHPLGRYIVDFVCLERRIVVEVDGGQHFESRRDAARDAWLKKEGYTVFRFWNNDVLRDADAVVETLRLSLENTPTHPSPLQGEGSSDGAHSCVPSPWRGEGQDGGADT